MVEICSLASGSNGNCYYVGDGDDAVIVDAGISYTRLHERINAAGLDEGRIRAVFVTHEHRDHSGSVRAIAKKLSIQAYLTPGTYNKIYKRQRPDSYSIIEPDSLTEIGGIKVYSFPKRHDAAQPVSFRIEAGGHSVGVMTDIGIADDAVRKNFGLCDAVFLEANYDPQMLADGPYADYLKARIASEIGHLSNEQSADLVGGHASPSLTHLILSHISADNNTAEKVQAAFAPHATKYEITLASRYECGKVIRLL